MIADANDPRLDELLLRWEELHEQGQSLSPDELCSTYPELAGELARRIALLRKMDPLLGEMNAAPGDPASATPVGGSSRVSATAHADFHDLRFHAAGALGEVFMARNTELNREVAIKFLKPERSRDPDSLRRFLQEAEVTGRLEHPGVVPIYALGTDGSGAPCYAMRFIRGETLQDPIDAFHAAEKFGRDPSERSLALRDLLNRFVSICNTMAYAHSRGILHRDLKPRNVMLGKYDETLVVDWGLAKPFDGDEVARSVGEETLAPSSGSGSGSDTPTVGVVGTPAFMSPEQAEARWAIVGPASDIFGLGAMLYAILTGRAPYQGRTIGEILETVKRCEFPPPRQVRPGVSRALEAVCLRAMAPQPDDRYATAIDLAADIRRWLADEPVTAYTEPLSVRTRRWMRRHRTMVTSAAAALVFGLAVLAGFATVLAGKNRELDAKNAELANKNWELDQQRRTAEDQRNRAVAAEQVVRDEETKTKKSEAETKAVLEFFQNKVMSAARPKDQEGGLGIEATIRQAVDAAEPGIEKAFADQPTVEASIRETLAESYRYLGEPTLAVRQGERTLKLRRQVLGPDHPFTLKSMNDLAVAYEHAGQLDRAIALHQQSLEARRARLGENHPDTLTSMNDLAVAYQNAGQLDRAIGLHEQVLGAQRTTLGEGHPNTLESMNNLAVAYDKAGQFDRALPLLERALSTQRGRLGEDHPDTLSSMNNLAMAYRDAGQLDRAIPLHEQTLKVRRAKLGEDHPNTLVSMGNLALAYREAGQLDRAIPLFEQAFNAFRIKLGEDHPDTLRSMNNLAVAYRDAGRLDRAIPLYEQALKALRTKLGDDHGSTLNSMNSLAFAYRDAGQLDRAIPLHEQTLKQSRLKLGEDHPITLISMGSLALAYRDAGRLDRAIPLFEQALDAFRVKLGDDHPNTLGCCRYLARAYEKALRYQDAEPLYLKVIETAGRKKPRNDRFYSDSLAAFGHCLIAEQKHAEAATRLRECLEIKEKTQPNDWTTANARSLLGEALAGQKAFAEAEPLLLDAQKALFERRDKILPIDRDATLRNAVDRLVRLYEAWGKPEKVRQWRAKLGMNASDLPLEVFAR